MAHVTTIAALAGRALLLAGALMTAATASLAAPAARPSIFNSTEVPNGNLKPFPKWTTMLQREIDERGKVDGSCQATRFNKCHYKEWQTFVAGLAGRPLQQQLDDVNRFMNRVRYIIDPKNWGMKDYWATPQQFFSKDGDCEDYAIAKFLTLKRAGVDASRMRIVILQDLNLRVAHAVLAVFTDAGVKILDNQIRQVVDERKIRHYRPIFSINETGWWLHRPVKRQRAATRAAPRSTAKRSFTLQK